MSEDFRRSVADDLYSLMEDAILSGGFDDLVLRRVAELDACKPRTAPPRRPRCRPRRL